MKSKDKTIIDFIFREMGIEISPLLDSLIRKPQKIETLNYVTLEKVVKEYTPIYNKYKNILDGPKELQILSTFEIFLISKLNNKPELQTILYK